MGSLSGGWSISWNLSILTSKGKIFRKWLKDNSKCSPTQKNINSPNNTLANTKQKKYNSQASSKPLPKIIKSTKAKIILSFTKNPKFRMLAKINRLSSNLSCLKRLKRRGLRRLNWGKKKQII